MTRGGQTFKDAARRRSEQAEQAVLRALVEARKTNGPITFTGLAARARVSTDFIYRHPELRAQVEALRRARTRSAANAAGRQDIEFTETNLISRLSHQLAELRRRHREEIVELRRALAAAHGELLYLRERLDAGLKEVSPSVAEPS